MRYDYHIARHGDFTESKKRQRIHLVTSHGLTGRRPSKSIDTGGAITIRFFSLPLSLRFNFNFKGVAHDVEVLFSRYEVIEVQFWVNLGIF